MESTRSNLIAAAALEYAGYGWQIVPLKHRSKSPRINAWQNNCSSDEGTIADWFDRWPDANIGVRLGEMSGVIDIECDDDEAEKTLQKLFNGDVPPTPTYAAARGKHRLFKWSKELPEQGKALFKIGKLEFRTGNGSKGAQSVFPPSVHPNGAEYKWLVHPSECDVAEIPREVITRIFNWCGLDDISEANGAAKKTVQEWREIAGGVSEGSRNESMASVIGGLLRRLSSLDDREAIEIAMQAARGINNNNIPPLEDRELVATFNSILRREQQRRASEIATGGMPINPQVIAAQGQKEKPKGVPVPAGMRLVVVRDDPPIYELYADQFTEAPNGCIRLTAGQLCSFDAIRVQALEQACYPLPLDFKKAWNARGGLYEQLVFGKEEREANASTKRLAVAAEYLLDRLSEASENKNDADEPDPRKPTVTSDGSIWFRWGDIWRNAILGGVVHRDDPKRLAHSIGMSSKQQKLWPARGKGRRRYVVFDKELMAKLEAIAEMGESAHSESCP